MERDKRGRFVKKADSGTSLNVTPSSTLIGLNYTKPKLKYSIYSDGKAYDQFGKEVNPYTLYNDLMSLYETNPDGTLKKDVLGNFIRKDPSIFNKSLYEFTSYLNPIEITTNNSNNVVEDSEDPSYGMNISNNKIKKGINNLISKPIDRNKLAGFLDIARAGIESSLNNKIAERSLKSEKPFLQDVSESHRSIYGDYRAQVQGEKAAALLRNMASKPLTSDGALLQQMMMDAQIKGLQYIDQGNAQDEAMIKQTREVAWQQEKENLQQRLAAAMQNKQAMLMSEKNKANIENMRDSANISLVVSPLLAGWEQRLRNKGAEQEYYQDLYNNAMVDKEVWHDESNLSPEFLALQNAYLTGGLEGITTFIGDDETKKSNWIKLQQIKENEILRRQAALKGVILNTNFLLNQSLNNPYGLFGNDNTNLFYGKKGGIIYKARLTKRTRDNDRAAKSIESSKKIAARFLEKAIESLYTYNDVELIVKSKNKKKKKYLAGGGLPFVSHTPIFATSETGVPKTTKSEDSDDLTTKDILELLKDMDGLPADMQLIIHSLKNFSMRDRMDPLGLNSSSNLASQYINIINKIKIAKFNREEYNNAFNLLKGNGGLNELAVTSNGYLIGTNENGDFEYFTPDLINSEEHSKQGYLLLTNSNLLYLRANSLEAAFNHNLTTVAQNGIGMEVITKQINDILSNLGSSKEYEEGFIKIGSKGQIKEGLKYLQKAAQEIGDSSITDNMSVTDYYLAGYLTEDLANQAQLALNYIWSALPTNAQSLLQVKGKSIEGAENIIKSLVYSKTSTESQFKASPKKMSKESSESSNSESIDGLKLSPVQMMLLGYTDYKPITLQKGTTYATTVNAQILPMTYINKESLGVTTLDKVAESTFGGALDMNNVTMGGQSIDPHSLQNVQIDGTNLYIMNLPIDKNSLDGTIKPDLAWMTKIEAIDEEIRNKGITDIDQINKLYTDAGLPILINDNGQLNVQDYCKFGVLNGHALNTAFKDLDLLDNTVLEIDDEDLINNIISILNKGRSEKDRIDFDSESFFDSIFGTKHSLMFEGTIYIPVKTNAFTGMISGGQYPTAETAEEVEALIQQKERTRGYVDPGLLN